MTVEVGGVRQSAGPPLRQAVLAYLSSLAGSVVSKEQLMDAVWGEHLPGNASGNIHTYIAALRKQLDPGHQQRATDGVLASVTGGYCLRLPPAHLDSTRFLDLCARARTDRGRAPDAAARDLRRALDMWRGTSLQGVPGPFAQAERERLTGLRLSTVEDYARLMTELGHYDIVVQELSPVVRDHPLRESAHALMMTALERSGHRDEALRLYDRIDHRLREELAVPPRAALRELYRRLREGGVVQGAAPAAQGAAPGAPRILSRTPAERAAPSGSGGGQGSAMRHLPPRPGRFVGREGALATLREILAPGGAARLCVVAGSGGVGKTTLALEWAHRSVKEFPDGCLHAEMRGFNPTAAPLDAGEALYDFLVALDVAPDRMPHTVTARAALFRALTEDRRLLVVLDDVRCTEQALPLLPSGPGCATLITSRRRLDTLVVRHAGRPLLLGPMSHEDARKLLDACAGFSRTGAEPAAADELVRYCARLPLAVAVIGNRVVSSPQMPLHELLERVRDGGNRLDMLSSGLPEIGVDLRTVFRASIEELSAQAREAFCLLSLCPGSHIDLQAAGALLNRSPRQAAELLAELTANTLLSEVGSGRYRFHDLLGEFARELAAEVMTTGELEAAHLRLLRWTLHAVCGASTLIAPRPLRDFFPAQPTPWSTGGPTDRRGAARWLATRQHSLVATSELALRCGQYDVAWRIPVAMTTWFYVRKNWSLWLLSLRVGALAARRAGSRTGLAQVRAASGLAHLDLRRYRQARKQLTRAAAEFQQLGEYWQLGTVLVPLGDLYLRTGRPAQALHTFESARRAYERTDDHWGTAWALSALGRVLMATGSPGKAIDVLQRAMGFWRKSGYTRGEADAMMQLGQAQLAVGSTRDAQRFMYKADSVFQSLGDSFRHAQTLVWIGRLRDGAGDTAGASEAWRTALKVFEGLDAPEAAECSRLLGSR
ncbi:AfsR/SARP family transcriptional regulator [Streptomyces sp. NBC_01089]|uniref:AfsR/SARP family transcriptional regulator n=1 Tax=Streptomyces sp. NBC_01089 TaxID=2903747 RepID=UPI00386CA816|nr:tetratricopeptide repeat protein [Streptomyces sp. NBC_01089]